jgi:hypothetical protein
MKLWMREDGTSGGAPVRAQKRPPADTHGACRALPTGAGS